MIRSGNREVIPWRGKLISSWTLTCRTGHRRTSGETKFIKVQVAKKVYFTVGKTRDFTPVENPEKNTHTKKKREKKFEQTQKAENIKTKILTTGKAYK